MTRPQSSSSASSTVDEANDNVKHPLATSCTRRESRQLLSMTWQQVVSLVLVFTAAAWTLALMILWQATPLCRLWHPAAALLALGAAVQATLVWQGTRQALPALVQQELQQQVQPREDEEEDASPFSTEYTASHPWTAALVQHVAASKSPHVALQSFDTGSQALLIVFIVSAAPVATDTVVYNMPAWLVTLTSILACATWWTAVWQLATQTARQCRLDWLNVTPAIQHSVWYSSLLLDQVGIWYLPRHVMPALFQPWAEKQKPQHHQDATTATTFGQDSCLFHARVVLSATVIVVAVLALGREYSLATGGAMLACSVVAAVLQAIPMAKQQLTLREQQAASIVPEDEQDVPQEEQQQDATSGRQFIITTCWISIAAMMKMNNAPVYSYNMLSAMVLTLSAVLVVTAISHTMQAIATAFPVAFLTTVQDVTKGTHGFSVVTAAVPVLQPWVYPSYQADAVYVDFTHMTRQDLTMPTDIESPNKRHIDSYPTPEASSTVDPLVFEEHAF